MYYRHIYDQKKLKKLYDLNSYKVGVWYHKKENYYTRDYLNGKEYRKFCNRKLRRHLKKILILLFSIMNIEKILNFGGYYFRTLYIILEPMLIS